MLETSERHTRLTRARIRTIARARTDMVAANESPAR